MYVEYSSNNSGSGTAGSRFLGVLAKRAFRLNLSLRDVADEFVKITGADPLDPGCACCGQPHNFTEYDDQGKFVKSGPGAEYTASWA